MPLWPWPSRPGSATLRNAFGFAVVGLGHGAQKFLEAVQSSPSVRVAALVSGDRQKAERLARRHAIPAAYSYADFDRLADNPGVHAVYLCLPNALHCEFTERAARAGKHVLCEKPMAATVGEAEAMIEACRSAQRLLMIGYRMPFTSVHKRAKEIVGSGRLGAPRSIRSGFGFPLKGGWRADPGLAGGGSLYDVGIYPVHLLHSLFGHACSIESARVKTDAHSGLEMEAAWTGSLGGGAKVQCRSSYLTRIPDSFQIEAEGGTLDLRPAFAYSGLRLRLRSHSAPDQDPGNLDFRTPRDEPSAFRLEAEHLAECALTGAPLSTPGEVGLRDMQTLTRIYAMAE